MTHTDWRPKPTLARKRGREVWDHEGPHRINDGEIDGEIEFSDAVLEGFRDEDD
ncbi:hypothetical protein [Haloterrigena alkaliphila]|uniref:Uncharacterized protein n=1 Tax=Haloterrigena alkaliphila TaxID=2816475 RepID=A0A8A2VG15_9EURY|nr:hypothetical protein [Haloterrigena alkaliphila]QSW99292.1 hypothetical protein J0X25_18275 [Haloterrigena alkaliphila]